IGGSLAHGDPASDLPTVLLIAQGSVTLQGPGGQRTVEASELFRNYMETAVGHDEVLTEVRIPAMEGWEFGYEKFNRRSEDWAMVAVSALVKQTGDICEDARIGLTNMGAVPLRAAAVEEALRGQPLDAQTIARAAGAGGRRGRSRQDRGREGARGRFGRALDPLAVPRGHRPASRGLRLGLRAPAAGAASGRVWGRGG